MPQFAGQVEALLSDATVGAYLHNYVPTFVHGAQFGFSTHPKDVLPDQDDPVLELPFYKAQELCEILGVPPPPPGVHWKAGRSPAPSPPPGRPAYAQPLSP